MFRRKLLTSIVLVAVLGGGVLAGNAYSSLKPHNHELTITASHGNKRLVVQESTSALTITSSTYVQLTGEFLQVPATGNFRVQASFSGESACDAGSWCTLQLRVNGVSTNPKSGSDFAFDSPGGNVWTSNAMQGTSDVISGTGTARNITVEVYWAVVGGGSWRLDDWNFSAELWKV
jgi:hypothetical protein